jgi:hypothetical protein
LRGHSEIFAKKQGKVPEMLERRSFEGSPLAENINTSDLIAVNANW